jgi:hypothetical protein
MIFGNMFEEMGRRLREIVSTQKPASHDWVRGQDCLGVMAQHKGQDVFYGTVFTMRVRDGST